MLPGALLCAGHTHRAEPPSVPEAQYWRPPSLPPFSHPENRKRRQALPFPPSGSGFTLPLCRVRGPAQADRASGLTTSVPCLKLSVAPHQLLHKVRIPRWCPTALGDRPLPASRGPVCPPGLPTPASCPPPVALRVHLACPGPLPGVLCVRPPGLPPPTPGVLRGRPACPCLQATGSLSLRVTRLGSVRCPLLFLLQIVLFPLAAGLAPVCPLRRVTSALSTLCPSWASQSPSGPALPGHPGISSSVDMTTSPDFWSDTPPTPASPHRAWPMAGA